MELNKIKYHKNGTGGFYGIPRPPSSGGGVEEKEARGLFERAKASNEHQTQPKLRTNIEHNTKTTTENQQRKQQQTNNRRNHNRVANRVTITVILFVERFVLQR